MYLIRVLSSSVIPPTSHHSQLVEDKPMHSFTSLGYERQVVGNASPRHRVLQPKCSTHSSHPIGKRIIFPPLEFATAADWIPLKRVEFFYFVESGSGDAYICFGIKTLKVVL
jgi:hypothetical protein